MAEYIERVNYCKNICLCSEDLCEKEKCPIWRASTADVEPVRHGHWIPQFVSKRGLSDHFMCSECAESTFTPRKFKIIKYTHCPNCGAKMDGESNGCK